MTNIKNIEKELIQILITKSTKIGNLLYYTDTDDIERNLKQNKITYNKKDLKNIDITYINIKGEDEYQKKLLHTFHSKR